MEFLLGKGDYGMKCAILRGRSTRVPLSTNRRISIEAGWCAGAPQAAHIAIVDGHDTWQIFPDEAARAPVPSGVGAVCPIASHFHDTITDKPHTVPF